MYGRFQLLDTSAVFLSDNKKKKCFLSSKLPYYNDFDPQWVCVDTETLWCSDFKWNLLIVANIFDSGISSVWLV